MYRRIVVIGGSAAAVLGIGTAALATTGSDTPSSTSGTPSAAGSAGAATVAKHHPLLAKALARHAVHGQVVTKGKDGYVTHDGVVGTVAAVSATAITVKASDGFTQTFSVGSSTTVRVRTDGKGAKGAISEVHDGDQVAVTGSGTSAASTPSAKIIVDVHKS